MSKWQSDGDYILDENGNKLFAIRTTEETHIALASAAPELLEAVQRLLLYPGILEAELDAKRAIEKAMAR